MFHMSLKLISTPFRFHDAVSNFKKTQLHREISWTSYYTQQPALWNIPSSHRIRISQCLRCQPLRGGVLRHCFQTKLKQQDQSLMRQFLQLRSVIYKLKGTVTSDQRPAVKLPHIAASVDSFDRYESNAGGLEALQTGETNDLMLVYDEEGDLCELDDQMALMEDPYLPEFRGRTVSLLGPGNITRTRPGSGGFGYLKSRTMSFSVGTSARELDRAIVE
ncbi:uncharacterized protein LOC110974469 isoform X2 [Acanthaster planci]|uniref:Uncharacterized protein LOC110974469 isoform X2 n=1 Tax=Acanthaster planci TaxID=133434 RepID=A0A8B7XP30_ACAPL|nr:uncharacterized protein LOC110974469 isoform X2 [Acanthaster planci]